MFGISGGFVIGKKCVACVGVGFDLWMGCLVCLSGSIGILMISDWDFWI